MTVAPVRARVRHVRECTPGAVRACVCARAIVFQGALRKTRRNSAHIHLAQSERTKMRPKKHATWKWIDEEVMGEREKADWVSMAREQTVELKLGTAQSMRASMPTGNQTPRRSLSRSASPQKRLCRRVPCAHTNTYSRAYMNTYSRAHTSTCSRAHLGACACECPLARNVNLDPHCPW